jgi:GTPase SAR1 family protein
MWIQQIRQYGNNDIKRLLVGNKSDLTDQRTVEYEKAKVFNTHKISNELFFVS